MDNAFREVIAIFSGVIVLAIIATLVGTQAQTANILTATFKGLGGAIGAAEAPVTGGTGGAITGLAIPSLGNNNY